MLVPVAPPDSNNDGVKGFKCKSFVARKLGFTLYAFASFPVAADHALNVACAAV
jgi:hypothetical protein